MGAPEEKKTERWDVFRWFCEGLDNISKAANKAKDQTDDAFKKAKLDGYIAAATDMKDAVMERWLPETKNCAECGRPMFKRNAIKFCSARCRDKNRARAKPKDISQKVDEQVYDFAHTEV